MCHYTTERLEWPQEADLAYPEAKVAFELRGFQEKLNSQRTHRLMTLFSSFGEFFWFLYIKSFQIFEVVLVYFNGISLPWRLLHSCQNEQQNHVEW